MQHISCDPMRILALALALALSMFFAPHASAWQIRDWTNQADVICVATATSVQEIKNGTPPFTSQLPVKTLLARLQVQALLKGQLPADELSLELYSLDLENLPIRHSDGFGVTGALPFSRLEIHQSYLIFAKKHENRSRLFLVNYTDSTASAIKVGPPSKELSKQASALTNILLQLLAAADSSDARIHLQAVEFIGDFGDVFWDTLPYWSPEYAALVKNAPDNESIETLVRNRVIPVIERLMKSNDQEMRITALMSAAALQIVEAIPQLVALVESKSEYAPSALEALGGYRTFKATRTLVDLLKHPNQ